MTELTELVEVAEPVMNLTKRQRAMLKEMGVQVWQPLPAAAPAALPAPAAVVATTSASVAAPATAPIAINSGAVRAVNHGATGTFDTEKQPFEAPQALPEPLGSAEAAWRIGQLQTLYTPASSSAPANAARWLVLLECPASALLQPFSPFEGDAGKLLDNMLRAAHLHTAGAAMLAPLVRGGGAGGDLSADLADTFASAQASVVLVMGRLAAQALLQSTEPLAKLRGQVHAVQGQQTIITIDPTYLLRNPLDKAKAWDDLCLALTLV